MIAMRYHLMTSAALIAALGFSAACAKKEAPAVDTSHPAAAPAPAPAAFAVADIDVGRHIGADKTISDKTDEFAPHDTIYASVHTTGAATNRSITGRWTFQDGQKVDERSESISPTGDAYTEFHIVKPSGWPKGKYTLHVLVDSAEVKSKDVTVK